MTEQTPTIGGPDQPCARTMCATLPPHLGGAHIDSASDLYDGPDIALRALPAGPRRAASAVLHASRADGWRTREVATALGEMAREILRLREQVAAARVDRDRGIREAMKRAEDCAEHGATIRAEGHQAHYFSVLANQYDAERLVWLGACQSIREAFDSQPTDVARRVVKFADDARETAHRARKRFVPPTFADCQRAERCAHPATPAHGACERLREAAEQ